MNKLTTNNKTFLNECLKKSFSTYNEAIDFLRENNFHSKIVIKNEIYFQSIVRELICKVHLSSKYKVQFVSNFEYILYKEPIKKSNSTQLTLGL